MREVLTMCGRFSLSVPVSDLLALFGLDNGFLLEPRYNIAPTQGIAAVRNHPGSGRRELTFLHWGLIPSWAKDPGIGNKMINARAETVREKPSFRNAFKRRRCLIPASGFYEWQRTNGKKQPYHIGMQDGSLFALGGLWEHWHSPDGSEIESCAIVTTEANELMRPIHDRMPVIVAPQDFAPWLDTPEQEAAGLAPLLKPFDPGKMKANPVSTYVNNARHEGPACLQS